MRWAAAVVFIVATLTDRVDGDIARRRGLITNFGKIADPIADKTLMGMAFVGLSVLGELPWWVTVVVLVREWGVTVLRFFVIRHGVMPAGRGGKVKTTLQFFGLLLFTLPLSSFSGADTWTLVAEVIVGLAVVVTVVTGLDIAVKAAAAAPDERAVGDEAGPPGGQAGMTERRRRRRWWPPWSRPDAPSATAESLTGGLVCARADRRARSVRRGRGERWWPTRPSSRRSCSGSTPTCSPPAARSRPRWPARWRPAYAACSAPTSASPRPGVAGPDPQDGHPVGTVFVAVAAEGRVLVRELALTGDRAASGPTPWSRPRAGRRDPRRPGGDRGDGVNGTEDSRPVDG